MQAELYSKSCKICQQFKYINTLYGRLPPKNISGIKPWDAVHVELIGLYSNYIIQQQPGGAIIKIYVSLTCMTMIDPATGWFGIVKVPTYDLDEVMRNNYEYIDKSSARVIHLFNNTWLSIYPCLHKVFLDNISKFRRDFTPLLKYFNIKPALTTVKNPQANASVERVNQLILNMLVTKYLDNKVFNYIYSWVETLASISW